MPNPPEFLPAYYEALERVYGFEHKWIRTHYAFDDVDQAIQLAKFFFGEALAEQVRSNNSSRLPECAGAWWLRVEAAVVTATQYREGDAAIEICE